MHTMTMIIQNNNIDNNGKVKLVIENPISYYVEEDNMSYPPHVHFFVSNKKNTQWLKKKYTISI